MEPSMEYLVNWKNLNEAVIKTSRSIRSKCPKMDSREQIALVVYNIVIDMLDELKYHSNANETTFIGDILNFCKDKIEYYENG